MATLDCRVVFVSVLGIALVAPIVVLPLAVLAATAQAVLAVVHACAYAGRMARPAPRVWAEAPAREAPGFSVHIAIHAEPPQVVGRTLRCLAAQRGAPRFEVIVLDNNTADPTLWQPVEALCHELGPRFRFFHETGVLGAKAGALNLALAQTSDFASHVVVIDADYGAAPDFLARAAAALDEEADRGMPVDFVQFPQAYLAGPDGAGLSLELADYFHRHARHADGADAMLPTGTLSVIRRGALEAVGGWRAASLTEDSELGLRLHRRGFRGRFVDRVAGRGLLPLDLRGLELQRYRWAAGNMTVLLSGLDGLSPRRVLHVMAQLTAWTNFALPLAAALVGGGIAAAAGLRLPGLAALLWVAAAGLWLVYLTALLPLALRRPPTRRDRAALGSALAARVALLPAAARGTADAILRAEGGFRRTPKDSAAAQDTLGWTTPLLALCGLALLAAPEVPAGARSAAALLILPLPLALITRARLAACRLSVLPAQECL